jgi:hypothetical protein
MIRFYVDENRKMTGYQFSSLSGERAGSDIEADAQKCQ